VATKEKSDTEIALVEAGSTNQPSRGAR
jgi:hypothetical protein